MIAPILAFFTSRLGKYAAVALGTLILIAVIWWQIDRYGDSRYQQGVDETDASWHEASERLKADAARSATRADDAAAVRHEEHANQIREEQERIDEAQASGNSVFDALF